MESTMRTGGYSANYKIYTYAIVTWTLMLVASIVIGGAIALIWVITTPLIMF